MHKVLELLETLDSNVYAESLGIDLDPWQAEVLASEAKQIFLLASRQSGKTTTVALKASKHLLHNPGSLVLIISPSERQSKEVISVAGQALIKKGAPLVKDAATEKVLESGSRVIALPGSEKTVRGYSSVSLLIIDEASQVSDSLYYALRPMLAVSGGQIILLSTPFGKRGFFYETWRHRKGWDYYKITADECPRITREFLEEERRRLPEWFFKQEYFCEFVDPIGSVFAHEDILAAFVEDVNEDFSQNIEDLPKEMFVEMEDVILV